MISAKNCSYFKIELDLPYCKMIKILLVEDSPIVVTILKRLLTIEGSMEVVGIARTGVEGLELIPKVQPDVICTDLHMPQMNGLEFTSRVMELYPRPILVISASVQDEDTQNVFKLLEAGAVDIFPKPRVGLLQEYEQIKDQLIKKIQVLAGVKVFTIKRKIHGVVTPVKPIVPPSSDQGLTHEPFPAKLFPKLRLSSITLRYKLVVIGSSTGGPQALQEILTNLPADFPLPIVCVQHISLGFLQGLIDWLKSQCKLKIKIATQGELPEDGVIYFPPENNHLEFDRLGRFSLSMSPPLGGHRPSVTVTFKSASKFYHRGVIGILLTGMGRDGADGLLAIQQEGGLTIGQDEKTSVVFGMPKEAILLGAVSEILPITAIASFLVQKVIHSVNN